MKPIIIALLIAILVITPFCALADAVQGTWSGSAKAAGHSFGASCTFNGSGGFTARAAGMRVSGSYSISGSSVTLSAKGTSITFRISTDGNRQSMSGGGRYRGIKGSIYLSRTLSDSQAASIRTSPYAAWVNSSDTEETRIELYKSGYAYFSVLSVDDAEKLAFDGIKSGVTSGSISDFSGILAVIDEAGKPSEYIGRAELGDGVINVTPLNGSCPYWKDYEKGDGYSFNYKVESGKLVFGEKTFEYVSDTDSKPSGALFTDYITLERGDKGAAVKEIQQKLIELKFLTGDADGDFGPKTESAVKAFEQANGFEQNGSLNGEELRILQTGEESVS